MTGQRDWKKADSRRPPRPQREMAGVPHRKQVDFVNIVKITKVVADGDTVQCIRSEKNERPHYDGNDVASVSHDENVSKASGLFEQLYVGQTIAITPDGIKLGCNRNGSAGILVREFDGLELRRLETCVCAPRPPRTPRSEPSRLPARCGTRDRPPGCRAPRESPLGRSVHPLYGDRKSVRTCRSDPRRPPCELWC